MTVLSATAFVVLWERLGLGALPRALFLPSPGATVGERARIEHAAAIELSDIGLGMGAAADHELAAALRLLAAPEVEYYGWFVHGRAFGVHAARAGRHAVLATLDGSTVELWPADPSRLGAEIARRLPPLPPATTQVTMAEYSREAFEQATGAAITGNGQLFVAVRDRLGRRHQHEHAIEYLDTTRGRWLPRRVPPSAAPGTSEAQTAELDAAGRRLITTRRSNA